MRRVRVANKAEHLKPYLQRVCHVLNCCPQLLSFTRYPMGYCSASCMIRGTPHLTYSCSHAAASLQSRRISEHALDSRPPSSIGELRKPGISAVERPSGGLRRIEERGRGRGRVEEKLSLSTPPPPPPPLPAPPFSLVPIALVCTNQKGGWDNRMNLSVIHQKRLSCRLHSCRWEFPPRTNPLLFSKCLVGGQ